MPLDEYLTASRSVITPISSLSAMYFVYGLYTALFISYVRILRDRRTRNQAKTLYFWPTVILFFLATLVVAGETIYRSLTFYITFNAVKTKDYRPLIHYLQHDPRKTTGYAFTTICSILLNVVADYILIDRCYVIWGSRKRIAVPLAVASITTNMIGIVGTCMLVAGIRNTIVKKNEALADRGNHLAAIQLLMSVGVNMLITTLTAGRIWWMFRQSHGNEAVYKSISKIIIESGLIYPFFTLIHIIIIRVMSEKDIPFEFSSISYQTAGIAPTLIVVRAQLGKTVETVHNHTVVSDINFSSCPPRPDCSSAIDNSTQAPDDAFNMQQAHASGSGNLDWKKDTTSVANREHASHFSSISQTV